MSFAAYHPHLVNSIILLAPGGILRTLPKGYLTPFFRYPRLVSSTYLRKLVGQILGVKLSNGRPLMDFPDKATNNALPDMQAIVQWQFDHHKGFVHSFVDTVAHGPFMYQHSDWKKVCDIISGKVQGLGPAGQPTQLHNSKLLVIFGDTDSIVIERDVAADLSEMLGGPSHLICKTVPGGHGFPVPCSSDVVQHICDFWQTLAAT